MTDFPIHVDSARDNAIIVAFPTERRQAQIESEKKKFPAFDPQNPRHVAAWESFLSLADEFEKCSPPLVRDGTKFEVAVARAREAGRYAEWYGAAVKSAELGLSTRGVEVNTDQFMILWIAYQRAVETCASIPATSPQELRIKLSVIGKVWLKAEGDWYARLRAYVARDEAELARAKRPTQNKLTCVAT
jgi:hypothetical protein